MRRTLGPHIEKGAKSTFGKKRGSYKPKKTSFRRKYTGSMGGTGVKNMTKRSNALPT